MNSKNILLKILISVICILAGSNAFGQGPPITGDKPIMLGGQTMIFKTLTEIRSTDAGDLIRMPFMFHYLPNSNMLGAIHINYVNTFHGTGLGDINVLYKYQFYRKDNKGKTLRMVLKTYQYLPTGIDIGDPDFGVKKFQSYNALVVGYETIKHGIAGEVGYRYIGGDFEDFLVAKVGFGLPVLKPLYPPKQLNFYFENEWNYFGSSGSLNWMMAQGIQYVKGRWTWEISYQRPLIQQNINLHRHDYSIFLGTRFVI